MAGGAPADRALALLIGLPSSWFSLGTTATAASSAFGAPSSRSSRCCFCSAAGSSGGTTAPARRLPRRTTQHTAALRRTARAAPAPDAKSIAVLPFVDMSADKDQEYMSDGIAEELLNLLAKVPDLKVIARTSSFAFKGKDVDIAEIAKN